MGLGAQVLTRPHHDVETTHSIERRVRATRVASLLDPDLTMITFIHVYPPLNP